MNRRRAWFDLEERGVLWGMRLVLAAHRLLGRRFCLWLVNLVVFYYWLSNATARRSSRDYLQRLSRHAPDSGLSGGASDSPVSYTHLTMPTICSV